MGSGCGPGWEGAAPHKGLTSLESGSAQAGVWAGSRACPWLAPRSTPPLPHSLAPQLWPRRFAVSRLARGLREGVSVGRVFSKCVPHPSRPHIHQTVTRPPLHARARGCGPCHLTAPWSRRWQVCVRAVHLRHRLPSITAFLHPGLLCNTNLTQKGKC